MTHTIENLKTNLPTNKYQTIEIKKWDVLTFVKGTSETHYNPQGKVCVEFNVFHEGNLVDVPQHEAAAKWNEI